MQIGYSMVNVSTRRSGVMSCLVLRGDCMTQHIKIKEDVPDFFSKQVLEANRFYLGAFGPSAKLLAVVSGGCEHCESDYRIDRRDFPFYCLEFVARGKGSLRINDQTRSLSPGMVFTYGPGVAYAMNTEADDPFIKYFVDFTGRKAHRLLEDHDLGPGAVVQVNAPDVILHVFDDLVDNGASGRRFGPQICAILVKLLVLKITEMQTTEMRYPTEAFTTYQTCRVFIQNNYLRIHTLDDIAEACRVNKAYLCRLFQRFDNQSPYHYLMLLKMREAAKRLQRRGSLVKQVGYELGFEDPFHFCRVFKNVFGLSPAALKRLRQLHESESRTPS
jgi:AraC-like DNA-binding protein